MLEIFVVVVVVVHENIGELASKILEMSREKIMKIYTPLCGGCYAIHTDDDRMLGENSRRQLYIQ